ncbi:adhesion G-protein coupled receptor D1-like [Porites lutea]|uniref:adhesion G-protein coupled receptor D1-like n=1 Tax=Porites lutea TaxID=51062 RepID=UPI003CC6948C
MVDQFCQRRVRNSIKDRVSRYSSLIKALNVSNKGSLQEAINATRIFLEDLKKLPPGGNDINILVAIHELESFALKYGKTHLTANESTVIVHVQKLFVMKIQSVLENNTEPITCSKSSGTGLESIVIPSENFKAQDTVTVCTLYQGEVRKWIPGGERVGLNGKTSMNFTLSNIIGSTLDPRPQVILQKNLSVILRYDEGLEAHCVFWDFTAKSNFNGSWSSKGCSVVNRTKTEITCTCNHLTNFAVLMHVGADNEVPADHKVALKVITYVGCALSLIGEALTTVAYCVLM